MRIFINVLLLLTVSVFCFAEKKSLPQNLYALKYDEMLEIFHSIESGEAEKFYSEGDLIRLSHFITSLIRIGKLPGNDKRNEQLEKDVKEVLKEFHPTDERFLIPAIFDGTRAGFLQINWVTDLWQNTKKVAQEYKTEIIVAAVVIVSVTVIVFTLASESSEEAKAVAGGVGVIGACIAADQEAIIDDQIIHFKETLVQEEFFNSESNSFSEETGRTVGSLFAHSTLSKFQDECTDISPLHAPIDNAFTTDYTPLYLTRPPEYGALSYQIQGEKALTYGYYEEALHHFDKAIELDPFNPIPHLKRGITNLGFGDYAALLADYQKFTNKLPESYPVSLPEFSIGFAKGLPKGIYDSGSGLFLFMSDLVCHPINTSGQIWEALNALGNLVKSEEWNHLSQALAPEIYQLVMEWDVLSSDRRGELAGYAFGKYGADLLVPTTIVKRVASGVKGAHELAKIYKGLQAAEQTLLLDSIANLKNTQKINEVMRLQKEISTWLEEGTHLIRNKAGDPIFLSKDSLRRVRFDFNNPHGDKVHLHIEQKIDGRWQDASLQHRIYPIDE